MEGTEILNSNCPAVRKEEGWHNIAGHISLSSIKKLITLQKGVPWTTTFGKECIFTISSSWKFLSEKKKSSSLNPNFYFIMKLFSYEKLFFFLFWQCTFTACRIHFANALTSAFMLKLLFCQAISYP